MAENYYPQETDLDALEKEYQQIQEQYDAKHNQLQIEVDNIRRQFFQQAKPHFEKRDKYLNSIPAFWATAFRQYFLSDETLQQYVVEQNTMEALSYLKTLSFVDLDDQQGGFKMVLEFDPNDYFDNQKLEKSFTNLHAKPKITATKINWKHKKDIFHILEKEAKRESQQRQEEIEPHPTFFQIFDERFPEEYQDVELLRAIRTNLYADPLAVMESVAYDESDLEEEEEEEEEQGDGEQAERGVQHEYDDGEEGEEEEQMEEQEEGDN